MERRETSGRSFRAGAAKRIRSSCRNVYRLAGWADPFCRGWRWSATAIAIGTLPVLMSFAFGVAGHQFVSAALLTLVCLALARRDSALKAVAAISTVFLCHSVLVIGLVRYDHETAQALLPGGAAYWEKQIRWIETGRDPEYELSAWVPAHCTLLAGTTLFSCTSLGLITFLEGLHQVDLMNYYNGRLLAASSSPSISLALGWHIWSLLRGVGYVVLTFELVSISLQWLSGVRLSTTRKRVLRWGVGLAFLMLDGIVKYVMLETVRSGLFLNLR